MRDGGVPDRGDGSGDCGFLQPGCPSPVWTPETAVQPFPGGAYTLLPGN